MWLGKRHGRPLSAKYLDRVLVQVRSTHLFNTTRQKPDNALSDAKSTGTLQVRSEERLVDDIGVRIDGDTVACDAMSVT